MAHGAPDYWSYLTAGLPVALPDQIEWGDDGTEIIAGGGDAHLIEYHAPDDEELYVTGGYVSCDFPRLFYFRIRPPDPIGRLFFFDTFAHLPLNPSAVIRIAAGDYFSLKVFNDDDVPHTFAAVVYGFRIAIVPGTPPPAGLGQLVKGAGV